MNRRPIRQITASAKVERAIAPPAPGALSMHTRVHRTLSTAPTGSRIVVREETSVLKHTLIHPKINEVLGRAGHHAKILIADGNYPASTKKGPKAEVVCLNLAPNVVTCTQVLEVLLTAVPIDTVHTMMYTKDDPYTLNNDPPVWADYAAVLRRAGLALKLEPIDKWDFYRAVETPDHVLTVQTGDQQLFANLLLSVGVRTG
jgi:L-fucose mutarotase